MKYKYSPYDFTDEVVPTTSGELTRMLKNTHADVGNLFEFLAPILYNTPGVRAGKYVFTLVNVWCKQSGFSYGAMPPPPPHCAPPSCTYLFTFALSWCGYDDTTVIKFNSMRGIQARQWGHRVGDFMTIGVTQTQATKEFKLPYDMFSPMRIYYLLGALTKSFILRNRYFTPQSTYVRMYEPLHMQSMYAKYYMMPLSNLMSQTSYHFWVFNRHVWLSAPQLLSVKHITTETILYFCRYISNVGRLSPAIEAVMVEQINDSLVDMLQRHGNDSDDTVTAPQEDWQLLYAALCHKGEIPDADDQVEQWLTEADADLGAPSGDAKTHILNLIYA